MTTTEFVRIRKETVMAYIKYYSGICFEGLRKIMNILWHIDPLLSSDSVKSGRC
jgi:hypothetical protein